MTVSFEHSFQVHYHELDYNGNVRPVTLLNYLQDAAGMHARQLGVSVVDLREKGLTWVLSRIHIIFERYPRADESVLVRTWPSTREGFFSCREFELLDRQGCCTARATTSWAALNVATRRPVLLDKYLPSYPLLARRAVEDDFASLPLLPPEAETVELSFRVQRSDLDINQHVNNTIYAGWALETVLEDLARGTLAELEISFRAEALYGQSVLSRCAVIKGTDMPCCLHQIVEKKNGHELARLRTKWRL
ncbi:acyl-[acyl-carrier-protein] thioesterase [Pelotalea chapellei]|uniref:Acyl-ACP thioesterase n=1 Tax=Pelotalea chapellei TaxID=44671 RepID=A0ABS5UC85_9BACT|nr:acyl-ACP thioesterase [Pelotalea chapellei]